MNAIPTLIVFLSALLFARPALAYLDPSTGSMIITAIVGLFASIVLAVKTYWYKLKALFRSDKKTRSAAHTTQEADRREQTSED